MDLQKFLYKTQRTMRDYEVLTGRDGVHRYVKRVLRRQVRRKVTGPLSDKIWRQL